MKASYNWIQSYIADTLPSPEDVATRLTLASYEVESVETHGDDTIFDIDILPNRSSDSLGYIGIAREVALLCGTTLAVPFIKQTLDNNGALDTNEGILSLSVDSTIARRATKRIIRGVTVTESPDWLKKRLESVGQRSINNIVDATNFVMWELGNPVHAFDLSKIAGEKGIHAQIRFAQEGESVTALDGVEYLLNPSIPVIADDNGPLDIAGIKGGNHSGVDENTKDLMLSVCSFTPSLIRSASRTLGLRTDASKRFENDVPPPTVGVALDRLTSLILEVAGGIVEQTLDEWPVEVQNAPVHFKLSEYERIIGATISRDQADVLLTSLGCNVDWAEDSLSATITPPYWRTDLALSQQIIEELARLSGYDSLPKTPLSPHTQDTHDSSFTIAQHLRSTCVSEGMNEVFTYTFRSSGDIETKNKIASDKGFLRNNLFDGMKDALEQNAKHRDVLSSSDICLFEIGKVATSEKEEVRLCIGVSPAKGSAQKLLQIIIDSISQKIPQLSSLLSALPLEKGIIEFELNPEQFKSEVSSKVVYPQLINSKFTYFSTYPYIVRDVAFWAPADISDSDIQSLLEAHTSPQAIKISRFDRFEKEGRISHGFRIVFQSHEKTLTDEEIAPIMQKVYESLAQKGWEVR